MEGEGAGVEFEDGGEAGGEVLPVVTTRIETVSYTHLTLPTKA